MRADVLTRAAITIRNRHTGHGGGRLRGGLAALSWAGGFFCVVRQGCGVELAVVVVGGCGCVGRMRMRGGRGVVVVAVHCSYSGFGGGAAR